MVAFALTPLEEWADERRLAVDGLRAGQHGFEAHVSMTGQLSPQWLRLPDELTPEPEEIVSLMDLAEVREGVKDALE